MNDEPQHKHRKYFILALFAVFIAILGVILPETEFVPVSYINASNISYSGLTNVVGNISDISEINHGNWSADEDTSPWWINITFTNVTHFDFPETKLLYYSTVGASTHVNDIEIFCITEGTFVDMSTFTNQIEWLYWTRHIPDSMHFIDANGNVTIRLNHPSNGNTNHRIKIDVLRLAVLPQYQQINSVINQYSNTTISGGGGASNLSQLTIDTNKSWNGYNIYNVTIDNQTMSNKVNKTGDTMELDATGYLRINHSYPASPLTIPLFNITKNGTNRTEILNSGAQYWYLYSAADAYLGAIGYITSGGNPAIAFYDSAVPRNETSRVTIFYNRAQGRYNFQTANTTDVTGNTAHLYHKGNFVLNYGTVQASNLSSAGNYSLLWADSTGMIIKDEVNWTGTGSAYLCFNKSSPKPDAYIGNPGC